MPTFRIALSQEHYPNCSFFHPPCFDHPWISEITQVFHVLLRMLFPSNLTNTFVFVPAQNESHSVEMVHLGHADFTSHYLVLTGNRVAKYRHIGPLFPVENVFVFKSASSMSLSFNFFDLFPLKASLLGIGLAMVMIGLKHLKISPLQKVMHHMWPLSGIFASVFYAYFSGQIVLFFNKRPIVYEPITDFESLVIQIAAERYRLVFYAVDHGKDYGISDWAKQQSPQMFSSVRKSFRDYPTKIMPSTGELEAELLKQAGLPAVAPLTSIMALYLKSKTCGLATAKDELRSQDHYTVESGYSKRRREPSPMFTITDNLL